MFPYWCLQTYKEGQLCVCSKVCLSFASPHLYFGFQKCVFLCFLFPNSNYQYFLPKVTGMDYQRSKSYYFYINHISFSPIIDFVSYHTTSFYPTLFDVLKIKYLFAKMFYYNKHIIFKYINIKIIYLYFIYKWKGKWKIFISPLYYVVLTNPTQESDMSKYLVGNNQCSHSTVK